MIAHWPVWAQAIACLAWCAGIGALGGYLMGVILYRWPSSDGGRHRR